MSETLRCPKCGHEIDRENPVCAGCGAKLKVKPLKLPEKRVVKVPKKIVDENGARLSEGYCPQCGGRMEAGQKFCPACGASANGKIGGRTSSASYTKGIRLSQEIERDAVSSSIDAAGWSGTGGLFDPVFGCLPGFFLCMLWPELGVFLGIGAVTGVVGMVFRQIARFRLKKKNFAGAKSAFETSKPWTRISWIALFLGGFDFTIRILAAISDFSNGLGR